MNFTILTYDSLDSTNTEALKQAKLGAEEGSCIVARRQTAGRGRHGRTWVSEKNAGLYFSIILRPNIESRFLPLITLMAGVAVHDTLSELGLEPDIKWVNDILVGEKKIAGILAETTDTKDGVAVVVGVGINLRSSNFPPEIAAAATSVEEAIDTRNSPPYEGGVDDALSNQVLKALTKHLAHFYELLNSSRGPSSIIDEWRKRSTYFSGKRVRVSTGSDTMLGVTEGLEDNGALRVRKDDGTVAIVQAGDVERLRAEGD